MENLSGQHIKGYSLQERIGAGGFGAVYKAHQSTVGREVAMKIILPHYANHPEFIRRFETEAQLVARLEHLHIVPLYDYWRDPDGAYLVMRYMRGGTLYAALQNGPFEPQAAALLLDQIAAALATAHRTKVIHRDIKPANILLDDDGNAFLADFGIAKDITAGGNITEVDAIVGSPDYLAPEQARAEPVTAATDIYSLGVVLYELMTGEHPFPHVNAIERLFKHLNEPLPFINSLPDETRDDVNAVIQKATAKDPLHRYADALEMAAAFRQAIQLSDANLIETLTQREHEIMCMIIDGRSNKEIAQALFISVTTVKWHITQIYHKLGVRSRVQAIVRARELDLIANPDHFIDTLARIPTEDFRPDNPYKGLRAFQSGDYQDFYGREKLVEKLVKRLSPASANPLAKGDEEGFGRFLAVIGPSGSGKSSLVKAGVIPALWRGDIPASEGISGSEKWFIVEMLPGAHPLDELEIALTRVAANQSGNLREQLARDARGFVRAAQLILPNDGSELVLVIDQFEEVFTLVENENMRVQFLDLIYAAVTDPRSRVRVIVTLRADFYDRPLQYPQFGELLRARMETVLPLGAKELEAAVVKPATGVGVVFEEGLVSTIVGEINYQAGALPLLQYALTELFERREGRLLTHAAYQAVGRAGGALAKRADELYNELAPEMQALTRQMFLRLVTLGEGTEDTRRRTSRAELLAVGGEDMDEIIDTFAQFRLLSLDNDPGTRTPTVEIAHEALLREWERLRTWLNDSRDEVKLQRQLAAMTMEWRHNRQDISFLLRGARLDIFETWSKTTQLVLTPLERSFLEASLTRRGHEKSTESERQAREIRLERRSRDFLRGLVAVLLIATLGALGLTSFAVNRGQIAERRSDEARSLALAIGAQQAITVGHPDEALALANAAITISDPPPEAERAFVDALSVSRIRERFTLQSDIIGAIDFTDDGRFAFTGFSGDDVVMWDMETGQQLRTYQSRGGYVVKGLALSPDSTRLAVGYTNPPVVVVYDVQTTDVVRYIDGVVGEELQSLAYSLDGRFIAVADEKGMSRVLDADSGETVTIMLNKNRDALRQLAFSPDSLTLLGAADSGEIVVWEMPSGKEIYRLGAAEGGHQSGAKAVAFMPDRAHFVSVGDKDGLLLVWDAFTMTIVRRFEAVGTPLFTVAVSRDGQRVIAGGTNGAVFVWDWDTIAQPQRLTGHQGRVYASAFSPDGETALTGSIDNTLILWDLTSDDLVKRIEQPEEISSLAVSLDGRWLMAGSLTNAFMLQDLQTDDPSRIFEGFRSPVHTVAISTDNRFALIGLEDWQTVVWDMQTTEQVKSIVGGRVGAVSTVAFSADGQFAMWGTVRESLDIYLTDNWKKTPGDFSIAVGSTSRAVFSPDSTQILYGGSYQVIALADVVTKELIQLYEGHSGIITSLAFSPDGRTFASASSDTTIILWDVESGRILHRLRGHTDAVSAVQFSPDGGYLLSGSHDQTMALWDAESGDLLRRYQPSRPVTSLAFLPDGATAVSGGESGIIFWNIAPYPDGPVAWARANRYIPELTCDQRELYRVEPLCPVG